MDGVLRVRRHRPAVREAREVAAPQAAAGALEGVEAPTNALPEPPRARNPRPRRPQLGGLAEGLLARRRLLATPDRPTQRLLAQDHRPEGVPRPLPPPPGMLSEPPGADRTPGGVGGARASLAPPRVEAGAGGTSDQAATPRGARARGWGGGGRGGPAPYPIRCGGGSNQRPVGHAARRGRTRLPPTLLR